MEKLCVVFLCNKPYFTKFIYTCNQLLVNGKYKGDICLVIGDDLHNDKLLDYEFIKQNNIIIKYFPNIQFTNNFLSIQQRLNRPPHWFNKIFQFHKLHLFNTYFKNWEYIFYLDCGISIFSDISPMINEVIIEKNNSNDHYKLLAHSDAYPTYEWKLHTQFDKTNEYFKALNSKYNLNIDYFQTTIMLYNTKIIEDTTFTELLTLLLEYPISITNDQGIIALYFTNIKPIFKQIKINNENTYFYDYLSRNKNNKYIMLKEVLL